MVVVVTGVLFVSCTITGADTILGSSSFLGCEALTVTGFFPFGCIVFFFSTAEYIITLLSFLDTSILSLNSFEKSLSSVFSGF